MTDVTPLRWAPSQGWFDGNDADVASAIPPSHPELKAERGVLLHHSGCRDPVGFALHSSYGQAGLPDALASKESEWSEPPAKPHPRLEPRLWLLALVLLEDGFTGRDYKSHPKKPDQG